LSNFGEFLLVEAVFEVLFFGILRCLIIGKWNRIVDQACNLTAEEKEILTKLHSFEFSGLFFDELETFYQNGSFGPDFLDWIFKVFGFFVYFLE
jgi:hypothetical protein